jgi:hypothetical protein
MKGRRGFSPRRGSCLQEVHRTCGHATAATPAVFGPEKVTGECVRRPSAGRPKTASRDPATVRPRTLMDRYGSLNRSERRNEAAFLRFQLFRLFGLAIAVPVTSGRVFFHDGPVPINPTPTVDDNSAAAANKQRWRLPGFGRD